MVDIIIPHFGVGDLTALCQRCLETIREHTTGYRLIFVDNGSPEFDLIEPEVRKHPHLLIRNTQNVGFVKAVNIGLSMSTAPYVLLMNNDTEAVAGWKERLREGFLGFGDKRIGLVGPLMKVDRPADDPTFLVSKPCWQSQWKVRGQGPYVLPASAMVAFFCVLIHRTVLDSIGFLDERFGVGFGDDDDFCRRAHKAGFHLVLQQDLSIPHHHRSTFRALYQPGQIKRMQDTAMAKFKAKCRAQQ
jgi:GT2 family glycosyltransferase